MAISLFDSANAVSDEITKSLIDTVMENLPLTILYRWHDFEHDCDVVTIMPMELTNCSEFLIEFKPAKEHIITVNGRLDDGFCWLKNGEVLIDSLPNWNTRMVTPGSHINIFLKIGRWYPNEIA